MKKRFNLICIIFRHRLFTKLKLNKDNTGMICMRCNKIFNIPKKDRVINSRDLFKGKY